jgi:hypothetical protein
MNTRRENRLEELGRVDAEKAYTRKGKRNLREEKDRIRSELNRGGQATKPMDPPQRRRRPRRPIGPGPQSPRPKGRPKTRPKKMDLSDYDNFMDQYKKHKRDKFIRDLKDHHKRRKPGDPPRVIDPRAPRPKKDRIMTPLGVKVKYSSGGAVMAGKKVGCQIK